MHDRLDDVTERGSSFLSVLDCGNDGGGSFFYGQGLMGRVLGRVGHCLLRWSSCIDVGMSFLDMEIEGGVIEDEGEAWEEDFEKVHLEGS